MNPSTYWSELARGAREILGRPLSEDEARRFEKYMALLVDWNRVHRLIGSADPRWIVENVFLDSLLFLRALPADIQSLADVGSGAGIPGLPIKIVTPLISVTLIEARQRRVSFLKASVRELELAGVAVIESRAERVPPDLLGAFDAATARCTGPPERVFRWATALVRPGGTIVIAGPENREPATGLVTVPGWRRGQSRRFLVRQRI